MGHRSFKSIIARSMEEFKATVEIAKVTSVKKAITTFIAKLNIQIMNRNGFKEPDRIRKRLVKKHEIMLEYFEKRFGSFYKYYDYNQPLEENSPELRDRIWICWWQGEENAPLVVKRCIESIRRSAGNHQVTLITEDNFRDYVNIPQWVYDKFKAGIITRTNLSDLLRLSLLAQHGGMWIDSTFFCTDECNLDNYFQYPLWSIKRPDYLHCSIASGYFAGYSLMCTYENRYMFTIIRDFFLEYWANSDKLIDYLLVDYMIVLAQKYDVRVQETFKNITPNNPECDELFKKLGDTYNKDDWNNLRKETFLFKLSWKHTFPKNIKGKETYYSLLLDGKL